MNLNRVKRHGRLRQILVQGCLMAGYVSTGFVSLEQCEAQDSYRSAPPKAWRQAGPWRAIGIVPVVQKASAQETAKSPEAPASVVSAIATTESRQPSLVRVPSVRIEPPKALELDATRSVGPKVKLSGSALNESTSSGAKATFRTTNSSNLKVTRSGDITAETPVKVNFNQERIIALPALPSPDSPYAETGIEIPVRVDAVAETLQSIIDTDTPLAQLPVGPISSVPEIQIPLERPPVLESPEVTLTADTPSEQSHFEETQDSDTQETNAIGSVPVMESVPEIESIPAMEEEPSLADSASMTPAIVEKVVAAPKIMALPSVEATSEEIQAISSLNRSTQSNNEGVLSQPGAQVLITTGPMTIPVEHEVSEKVNLESQDIRALQVTGTISRLHVIDSSICQVVCNGNRLFIVADQTGETMIEVNMGKLHKPMYIQVVVQRPWARSSSASVSLEQMQAIVTRLAPSADVTVQPTEEGNLVVSGFAENNQQAKKVLEAIRKMVLVPVIDRIEIR
ncbi:MAG: hypothetical protein ACKN82_13180 [Pirellula sp.]